jgi:hypothetical protein
MMVARIADIAAGKIEQAIEELQVPQVVKDSIAWDIVPAVSPNSYEFMLVLVVPIPGTTDQALLLKPPSFDAFDDQAVISELVRGRLHEVQERADQLAADLRVKANGHKTSPGGLALP